MKAPLFVRPLSEPERRTLRERLHGRDAFSRRRCQMLLGSAQGQRPSQIAKALGCSAQAVRKVLHAFALEGLACLRRKPSRPKTLHAVWPKDRDEDLLALLQQSPRSLGKPTRLWTLKLLAQVCFEYGWTTRRLCGETIRLVLKRIGLDWKRAKQGLKSPPPQQSL